MNLNILAVFSSVVSTVYMLLRINRLTKENKERVQTLINDKLVDFNVRISLLEEKFGAVKTDMKEIKESIDDLRNLIIELIQKN